MFICALKIRDFNAFQPLYRAGLTKGSDNILNSITDCKYTNMDLFAISCFPKSLIYIFLYMMTSRLAHYRRKTGLSQEQLAAVSGVSARTIQRIESGKVEAHPATLKMLADALKVQTEELTVSEKMPSFFETKNEDKTKPLFHMFALIGLFFPVFNIILPALFWFFKKDESAVYDLEGKSVVNFQITMTLVLVPSVILMVFIFPVGFPLLVVVYCYTFFMSVVNVFRSINKRTTYYPFTCRFLR
jgi:uncharacterized Tic20 family protein